MDAEILEERHVRADSAVVIVVLEDSNMGAGKFMLRVIIEQQCCGDRQPVATVEEVPCVQHLHGAGRANGLAVRIHEWF